MQNSTNILCIFLILFNKKKQKLTESLNKGEINLNIKQKRKLHMQKNWK